MKIKKKLVTMMLLCGALALNITAATGCGAGNKNNESQAGSAKKAVDTTSENTFASGKVSAGDLAASTTEVVEPTMGTATYSWIARGFSKGDKAYFRIRDGASNLYGLADESGNTVIPMEYDIIGVGQDSVFCYRKGNKGYHNIVFDTDIKKIFEWDSDRYYIHSCNDGVAAFAEETAPDQYIYKDLRKKDGPFINPGEDFGDYSQGSAFYNGYALVYVANEKGGLRTCAFLDRDGEYHTFKFKPVGTSVKIPVMPLANRNGIIPLAQDGWMLYEVPPLYAQVLRLPREGAQYGFYNINAGQTILCPDGHGVDYAWSGVGGNPANTEIYMEQGYALWNNLKPADAAVPEYRVYDVNQGKFVTDEAYSYIELTDMRRSSGHILVQKLDGSWGYINSQFHPEQFFDDATSFYNGHALIVDGTDTYVVDENFSIVSDKLPGDGAFMLQNSDSAVFAAVHDPQANGYHVLTIEGGEQKKGNQYTLDPSLADRTGEYQLATMKVDDADIHTLGQAAQIELEDISYIELRKDGSGKLVNDMQIINFYWDAEKLYAAEEAMIYRYENGKIILDYQGSGGKIHMEYQKK